MGYMRHHVIVVGGYNTDDVHAAHEAAVFHCGALVSPIVASHLNGYTSFFVAPDGSKEGWPESEQGDVSRAALKSVLRGWPAKGRYIDWVEVAYPGDSLPLAMITDETFQEDQR